ncbi:MAG: polysaccharide biosynthesis/export family protein [Flavobacteriales bacterium]
MKLNKLRGLLVVVIAVSIYACNVNPSIMMKAKKDYNYESGPNDSTIQYTIKPSDILDFQLYTNEGTRLIDLTAISNAENRLQGVTTTNLLVEFDGNCKFPVIGRINLKDKTIKEAVVMLQEEYSKFYIKPFVLLKVINRRVTVFTGIGKAQVVPLNNEYTTIFEVLGAAGGLLKESKAHKVKLIRGDLRNPKVYLFDFSKIEGIKDAGFTIQANDIIYVEPRKNTVIEAVRDLAPVVGIITSTLTLIIVINNLSK